MVVCRPVRGPMQSNVGKPDRTWHRKSPADTGTEKARPSKTTESWVVSCIFFVKSMAWLDPVRQNTLNLVNLSLGTAACGTEPCFEIFGLARSGLQYVGSARSPTRSGPRPCLVVLLDLFDRRYELLI